MTLPSFLHLCWDAFTHPAGAPRLPFPVPGNCTFPIPWAWQKAALTNNTFFMKKPTSGDIAAGDQRKLLQPGIRKGHAPSLPGCTVAHKSSNLRKPSYSAEPSHGRVWASGQDSSSDEWGAREGPFQVRCCKHSASWRRMDLRWEEQSCPVVFVSFSNDVVTLFSQMILLHSWLAKG